MQNRELIKELLKLSDDALREIGRSGMTGDHGKRVAEHYVSGGKVVVKGKLKEHHAFGFAPEYYQIANPIIIVNGFEVPAPESEGLAFGQQYYIPSLSGAHCNAFSWNGDDFDLRMLDRGLVYLNADDAEARGKAMIKYEAEHDNA